jgi:hypothetical protein
MGARRRMAADQLSVDPGGSLSARPVDSEQDHLGGGDAQIYRVEPQLGASKPVSLASVERPPR